MSLDEIHQMKLLLDESVLVWMKVYSTARTTQVADDITRGIVSLAPGCLSSVGALSHVFKKLEWKFHVGKHWQLESGSPANQNMDVEIRVHHSSGMGPSSFLLRPVLLKFYLGQV